MYLRSKKWNTIIFAIILANIALFILYIIMAKTQTFISTIDYQNYSLILNKNISEKADYSIKNDIDKNSDWSWFTNTISCPTSVAFSWASETWTIDTIKYYFDTGSQILYCSWTDLSWLQKLILKFNSNFDWFTWAIFNTNSRWNLTQNLLSYSWILSDWTIISFSLTWGCSWSETWGCSWIDSNFNSDDYTINSFSWVPYPDNYVDNDNLARLNMYWYVKKRAWFYNIFWNNSETNDYISQNTNNSGSYNVNIWDTSSWKLYLDVDNTFNLKIIEFDSWAYTKTKELRKINEWNWNTPFWWNGYITESWGSLILDQTGSNAKIFDFKNKNYALFLEYSWAINSDATVIKYNLNWKNENGSWIYLNPLNDSYPDSISYLWSDIIIDNTKYISDIQEISKAK